MPVKWTPEIDQILLLKILETSDVSPKCVEIAERWPAGLDRPTPRAISERIFKIRATAKASGTATHFSVPSANTATPRKKAPNGTAKKAPPKKTNGAKVGAGKRKRGGMMSDEGEASDDSEQDGFKSDNNDSDASDDETPKKKAKANSAAAKGKSKDKTPVKLEDDETENKTIHDKGYENAFGGDGDADVNYA